MVLRAKDEIYRLPDRLVYALTKIFNSEEYSIWDAVGSIDNQYLSEENKYLLLHTIAFANILRLRVYEVYKEQKEEISLKETNADVFSIWHLAYNSDAILFQYYYVAEPLHRALQDLTSKIHELSLNKVVTFFANKVLYDKSPAVSGAVHSKLLNIDAAKIDLQKAVEAKPDDFRALIMLISAHEENFQYADIIRLCDQGLNLGQNGEGMRSFFLYKKAVAHGREENNSEAIELFREIIDLKQNFMFESRANLALLLACENVSQNLEEIDSLLIEAQSFVGGAGVGEELLFFNSASICVKKQDYSRAIVLMQRALEIGYKKSSGCGSTFVLAVLDSIAGYAYEFGEYNTSIEYARRAEHMVESLYAGSSNKFLLNTYYIIAASASKLGYRSLLSEYEIKIQLLPTVEGQSVVQGLGLGINSVLAQLELGRGDIILFDELAKKADELYPEKNSKRHSSIFYNKGVSLRKKGRLNEALECFKKSVQILENFPDQSLFKLEHYLEMGSCYSNLGDEQCIQYNKMILAEATKLQHVNGVKRLQCLANNNIGMFLTSQDKLNEAAKHFEVALNFAKSCDGDNFPSDIFAIVVNLGEISRKQGDLDKALEHYNKALKFLEDTSDFVKSAKCKMNIAITYEQKKEYQNALKYYSESSKEMIMGYGYVLHPDVAFVYYNIISFFQSLNHHMDALIYANEAFKNVENFEEHPFFLKVKASYDEVVDSISHKVDKGSLQNVLVHIRKLQPFNSAVLTQVPQFWASFADLFRNKVLNNCCNHGESFLKEFKNYIAILEMSSFCSADKFTEETNVLNREVFVSSLDNTADAYFEYSKFLGDSQSPGKYLEKAVKTFGTALSVLGAVNYNGPQVVVTEFANLLIQTGQYSATSNRPGAEHLLSQQIFSDDYGGKLEFDSLSAPILSQNLGKKINDVGKKLVCYNKHYAMYLLIENADKFSVDREELITRFESSIKIKSMSGCHLLLNVLYEGAGKIDEAQREINSFRQKLILEEEESDKISKKQIQMCIDTVLQEKIPIVFFNGGAAVTLFIKESKPDEILIIHQNQDWNSAYIGDAAVKLVAKVKEICATEFTQLSVNEYRDLNNQLINQEVNMQQEQQTKVKDEEKTKFFKESFELFLVFLDHANEKLRTAFILREIFDSAAGKFRKIDTSYQHNLGKCKILDLGCGEGELAKEVIATLSDAGFEISYEGVDPSAKAIAETRKKLEVLAAQKNVQFNLEEKEFNEYLPQVSDSNKPTSSKTSTSVNPESQFNFVLVSHSAYYARSQEEFIKQIEKQASEDSVLCFIHAPQISIHSQLRQKYAELKEQKASGYYDMPSVLKKAISKSTNNLKSITLPINSFVRFHTDLKSMQDKLVQKRQDFTEMEKKDKKLLEFILGKTNKDDLNTELTEINGAVELITEVRKSFLGGDTVIQIWAHVQIVANNDNPWIKAIAEVLPKKLDQLTYLSPIHWAAFEGRKDLYDEVKTFIEKIYHSQGKNTVFSNIHKAGLLTPLYMSILGAENAGRFLDPEKETEFKQEVFDRYIKLCTELEEYADDNSKKIAFPLCHFSDNTELKNLVQKPDVLGRDIDIVLMESLEKMVSGFSPNNIAYLDKKEANSLFINHVDNVIIKGWLKNKMEDDAFVGYLISRPDKALVVVNLLNNIVAKLFNHRGNNVIEESKSLLQRALEIEKKLIIQKIPVLGFETGLTENSSDFGSKVAQYLDQDQNVPQEGSVEWQIFVAYSRTLYFSARSYFYHSFPKTEDGIAMKSDAMRVACITADECYSISEKLKLFEAILSQARVHGYLFMDEGDHGRALVLYNQLLSNDKRWIFDGDPAIKVVTGEDQYFLAESNIRMFRCAKKQFLKNQDTAKLEEASQYLVRAIENMQHAVTNTRQIARIYNDLGTLLLDVANHPAPAYEGVLKQVIQNEKISKFLGLKREEIQYTKEQIIQISKSAFEASLSVTSRFENDNTRAVAKDGLELVNLPGPYIKRDTTTVCKVQVEPYNKFLTSAEGAKFLLQAEEHGCSKLIADLCYKNSDCAQEILEASREVGAEQVLHTLMGEDVCKQVVHIKNLDDGSISTIEMLFNQNTGEVINTKPVTGSADYTTEIPVLHLKGKSDPEKELEHAKHKVADVISTLLNSLDWDVTELPETRDDTQVVWLNYLLDVQEYLNLMPAGSDIPNLPLPPRKPKFDPDDFGGGGGNPGGMNHGNNPNAGLAGQSGGNTTKYSDNAEEM